MCGIFGFIKSSKSIFEDEDEEYIAGWASRWDINFQNTKEGTLYKTLLVATSLRGTDATGTTVVDHSDMTTITRKLPVNALQFMTLGEYELIDGMVNIPDIGVIGHCRAGTIGSASYRTSHPFDFDSVVGVHNGTLSNHSTLGVKNAISDSETIFYILNKSEDYAKDISRFLGSYALVWFDKTTKLYYFCRNSERPLWYYKTKGSLVFASELEILQFGLCRAYNESVEELKTKGEFTQFSTHILYEYDKDTGIFNEYTIEKPIYTIAPKAAEYYDSKKQAKKGNRYTDNRAEKDSPFQEGDSVELVPCGYTEYPYNEKGHGSLYGYTYYAGKSYFWITYGIQRVKDIFTNIYGEFPVVKVLYGSVSHQSYQDKRSEVDTMKDPLTGVKVYPERSDKDEILVLTIRADSLSLTEDNLTEEENKNLPAVVH